MSRGWFFSHTTAAHLWGMPLDRRSGRSDVHVSALVPAKGPRGRGVIGHRLSDPLMTIDDLDGLLVADPLSTWCQSATLLEMDDLVAVADHLVLQPVYGPPQHGFTVAELADRVRRHHGHGARRLAAALPLVRIGAESRPETLIRLALGRAGPPDPELNVEIRDAGGRFVARVDMLYRAWGVVVEYDGDHHRTSTAQYERDMTRLDALHDCGLRVVRIRRAGLAHRAAVGAAAVTRALRAAGWPGPGSP
jgi:hypothetical protein